MIQRPFKIGSRNLAARARGDALGDFGLAIGAMSLFAFLALFATNPQIRAIVAEVVSGSMLR